MSTTMNGHTLTNAERRTLNELIDGLRRTAGDSHWSNTNSPAGDGREVDLYELFGERNNRDNANRRTVRRLAELGVLRACEIRYERGMLKAMRFDAA